MQMKNALSRTDSTSGQALVEFALSLTLLLVILVGLFEMARLVVSYAAVAAAGREAARYGSGVSTNISNGIPLYDDCAGMRLAARKVGWLANVQDADIHILYDTGPGTTQTEYCNPSGSVTITRQTRIVVLITTPYTPMLTFLQLPGATLRSKSARSILIGAQVVP
jgi:Flp pilus assembly protein TadG